MIDMPYNQMKPNYIYLTYMYKQDLALNNIQGLICHKTKPTKHHSFVQVIISIS